MKTAVLEIDNHKPTFVQEMSRLKVKSSDLQLPRKKFFENEIELSDELRETHPTVGCFRDHHLDAYCAKDN